MLRRFLLLLLAVLSLALLNAAPASARGPEDDLRVLNSNAPANNGSAPAITLSYAQVLYGAAVYASPADGAGGAAPIDWLGSGFVFVSLAGTRPVPAGGQLWYHLNQGGYVSGDRLLLYTPSTFHGTELATQPNTPFAWVVYETALSASPGTSPVQGAPVVTRYTRLDLLERKDLNGVAWYRVGDGEWINQYRLGIVAPSGRPPAIGPGDRWIEVNLTEQTLAAYEGDRMVYATLVASGLPKWPTDPGLFRIQVKQRQGRMSGDLGKPDFYDLRDIPWIMYFNGDQALHTAYWHDGFGAPHSHGCVNLAPDDAMWLYNWSSPAAGPDNQTLPTEQDPGTWVWVHY